MRGDIGREDEEVLTRLMDHLIQTTGLSLRRADDTGCLATGEHLHCASRGASAPAGTLKLLLPHPRDAVRQLHAALNGRFLRVRPDCLTIEVHNEVLAARGLQGNWQGVR